MVEEEKLVGYEHLEKGTVQETMLGPVWARAKFSQKYPELLNDPKAVDIIEHIDHDFLPGLQFGLFSRGAVRGGGPW